MHHEASTLAHCVSLFEIFSIACRQCAALEPRRTARVRLRGAWSTRLRVARLVIAALAPLRYENLCIMRAKGLVAMAFDFLVRHSFEKIPTFVMGAQMFPAQPYAFVHVFSRFWCVPFCNGFATDNAARLAARSFFALFLCPIRLNANVEAKFRAIFFRTTHRLIMGTDR